MNKNCLRYTCLFGGGAMRGTAHVGVVKAMEELGIQYNILAGSSVGSIIAALLAVGYTSEELKEIFLQVNFELFRDIHFNLADKFSLSKGEVFLDWIRELIEKKFYGRHYMKDANKRVTFADIEKNLVIITTDLTNFKCKEFSRVKTPDYEIASAVRISSSMPGLMKPVEYENSLLVDGDLQKSWPMWALSDTLKNAEERILEIRLEGSFCKHDMNTINYANTVYSCVTSIATDFVLDRYKDKDKYDFIVVNTEDIVIVDFNQTLEKRQYMIALGYKQTMEYFRQLLPLKKEHLFEIYDKLYTLLIKVSRAIGANKIQKAKMYLLESYVYLSEHAQYIDDVEIKNIKMFKDLFLENIGFPGLLGRTSLKSKKNVVSALENILKTLRTKLIDLKNYHTLILK